MRAGLLSALQYCCTEQIAGFVSEPADLDMSKVFQKRFQRPGREPVRFQQRARLLREGSSKQNDLGGVRNRPLVGGSGHLWAGVFDGSRSGDVVSGCWILRAAYVRLRQCRISGGFRGKL